MTSFNKIVVDMFTIHHRTVPFEDVISGNPISLMLNVVWPACFRLQFTQTLIMLLTTIISFNIFLHLEISVAIFFVRYFRIEERSPTYF